MPLLLDLTHLLPGPLCARILADTGWEVLRLERPVGDLAARWAPELYAWLQTHKHTEQLDLKSVEGKEQFLEHVARADALVETNRPGVMERLGLGYARLSTVNARLTYVRLAGSRDPDCRQQPGHDLTYLAGGGWLPRMGEAWRMLQLADVTGALWGALAVEQGYRQGGGFYEVYLEEAPAVFGYPRLEMLDGRLVSYRIYEAAEGQVALAALEPPLWVAFCEAAGRHAWKGKGRTLAEEGNPVFQEICAFFRTRSAEAWDVWARKHRLPLRMVRPWRLPRHLCPW